MQRFVRHQVCSHAPLSRFSSSFFITWSVRIRPPWIFSFLVLYSATRYTLLLFHADTLSQLTRHHAVSTNAVMACYSLAVMACYSTLWWPATRLTNFSFFGRAEKSFVLGPRNPVYARRVDVSAVAFSLSSHRNSYRGLLFSSRFIAS
jgi:hypothetical protein